MSETKFTPGPWRLFIASSYTNLEVEAKCSSFWLAKIQREMDKGDGEANAHLIAAAPDLYAALEAMVTDKAFASICAEIGAEPQWLRDARSVLRKARGEQ